MMSQALHALQLSHRQSSYHASSQATIVANLSRTLPEHSGALLAESPSVASNSEQRPLCTTWCIHDCDDAVGW